jgi:predicted phage tail protein
MYILRAWRWTPGGWVAAAGGAGGRPVWLLRRGNSIGVVGVADYPAGRGILPRIQTSENGGLSLVWTDADRMACQRDGMPEAGSAPVSPSQARQGRAIRPRSWYL